MKKLLIVLAFLCVLTACGLEPKQDATHDSNDLFLDYAIDNNPLNKESVTYPLDALIGYFKEEYPGYTGKSIEQINEKFPIKHLRRLSYDTNTAGTLYQTYIVYRVQEGGNFIVLLSRHEESAISGAVLYVDELPDKSDLADVAAYHSYRSYGDVLKIAPCTYADIMGSIPRSYSLLRDGTVLSIDYAMDENAKMTVIDSKIIDLEKTKFSHMLPQDLKLKAKTDKRQGDGSLP